jgi:hypothetical protein
MELNCSAIEYHAKLGGYNRSPKYTPRFLLKHTTQTTNYCRLAPEGRGCAKKTDRDLAALVVLEDPGVPKTLSDAG